MSVRVHESTCQCHIIERESRVEPLPVTAERVMTVAVGR